mmetsp:Transcript_2097/g.9510  ORF Transcript_2097/g.9510 Transcript_2097/m.9510 type:complete len:226 (-) Transcript_2097:49-726(-)
MVPRLVNRGRHQRDRLVRVLRSLVRHEQEKRGDQDVFHEQLGSFRDDQVSGDGRGDCRVRVGGDHLEELHRGRGDVRDAKVGDVEVGEVQGDLPGERGIRVDGAEKDEERERAEGNLGRGVQGARSFGESRGEIGGDRCDLNAASINFSRHSTHFDATPRTSPALACPLRLRVGCPTIEMGPTSATSRTSRCTPCGREDRCGPHAEARDRHRPRTRVQAPMRPRN